MGKYITNRIDFLNVPLNKRPKPGYFIIGIDSADDRYKKMDTNGIVTIIGETGVENYTTGSTTVGTTVYYDTILSLSAYTADLSTLTGDTDTNTFVTGTTLESGTTLTLTRNDGVTINTDLSSLTGDTNTYTTGTTVAGNTLYFNRNDSLSAYTADLSSFSGSGNPSVQELVSSPTVTPNADSDDEVVITAQGGALTLANPTGGTVQGQAMFIRIKDNGLSRAITYGSEYREIGVALPAATVANKITYIGMIYNSTDTKWDCISTVTEV